MIKKILVVILLTLLGFILFFVIRLAIFGSESRQGTAPGLINNILAPCPESPNCINSEFPDDQSHFTDPLITPTLSVTLINQQVIKVVNSMGGTVHTEQDGYIAAIFTSRVFGFVDDFETRFDSDKNVLQIRSASRVGYGDMGVNAERVNEFRKNFAGSMK